MSERDGKKIYPGFGKPKTESKGKPSAEPKEVRQPKSARPARTIKPHESWQMTTKNPGCFLYLIDQSGTMQEPLEQGYTKGQYVADTLNRVIYELCITCRGSDGKPVNRMHIGVVGYGGSKAGSGFREKDGAPSSKIIWSVVDVVRNPVRLETRVKRDPDGAGGLVERKINFPIWFDPKNDGMTPMGDAFGIALREIKDWCDSHPDSVPPVVMNVTDGRWNDFDPKPLADQLKNLATNVGNCVVYNLFVEAAGGLPMMFPKDGDKLPTDHADQLFQMSSYIPAPAANLARARGYQIDPKSRFFGYMARMEQITDFFEIGSHYLGKE